MNRYPMRHHIQEGRGAIGDDRHSQRLELDLVDLYTHEAKRLIAKISLVQWT